MSRAKLGGKHGAERWRKIMAALFMIRRTQIPPSRLFFDPDGEVIIARSVPSFEVGEEFIRQTLEGFLARNKEV
jgi:hypothetical protein